MCHLQVAYGADVMEKAEGKEKSFCLVCQYFHLLVQSLNGIWKKEVERCVCVGVGVRGCSHGYMCMHLYVCICMQLCIVVCACVWACMWKPEIPCSFVFLGYLSPYILR